MFPPVKFTAVLLRFPSWMVPLLMLMAACVWVVVPKSKTLLPLMVVVLPVDPNVPALVTIMVPVPRRVPPV